MPFFAMTAIHAQNPPVAPANYDEDKIPTFQLTDPLKTTDGRTVNSPQLWNDVRRPELLKLFADEMFGKLDPSVADSLPSGTRGNFLFPDFQIVSSESVFGGKGTRYWITVLMFREEYSEGELDSVTVGSRTINVLVYVPNDVQEKVPLFLGLNFQGNHTVDADPSIRLGRVWRDRQLVAAREEDRGAQASRWQIEKVLDRGYATATAYYQEIEPDFDGGSKSGFRGLMDSPDAGNAIATWAWGLSIINDALHMFAERLNIDPERIVVHGHSRLGKAALWAGAMDERFAMVISNNSGCGGAALSRREYGETVHRINTSFPHWFNENFKKYNLDVNALPFDQHELIALIAPRPVYIASAVEDQWADPKGEFLSGLHADPVYRLLGTDGFAGVTEMPELNKSVGGTIGYHIRTGVHDVTEFDWEQFLNFADKHFKK